MKRITILIPFVLAALLGSACAPAAPALTPTAPSTIPMAVSTPTTLATPISDLTLTSAAFAEGESIPTKYTFSLSTQCNGDNISPPLSWTGVPAATQSLAIVMLDPDAGNFVHWVQFNIPPEVSELAEAVGGPEIGVKGVNDFGETGYGGPCPPRGTHRYVFTLYALDSRLSLPSGVSYAQFQSAVAGHILAEARLTGTRSR